MNRKQFTGAAATILASLMTGAHGNSMGLMPASSVETGAHPPYLQPGDTIGIVTPAGPISLDEIQPAVKKLQQWGFSVKIGSSVGKKEFTFGGTDEERRDDMQSMLDDSSIRAIICGRGGYGLVRIMDQLDFSLFRKKPKWIIGFSDITLMHNLLQCSFSCASIHAKMCNSFPADWAHADPLQIESIETIKDAIVGKKLEYKVTAQENNRFGMASGILTGGNLRVFESQIGTSTDPNTSNKILFLEDADEYLYNIDRMFWHLKQAGKLSGLNGLIIGGFRTRPDDPGEEFAYDIHRIVLEKVRDFSFPVCFGFPVGHQKHNLALKYGMKCHLSVSEQGVVFTQ